MTTRPTAAAALLVPVTALALALVPRAPATPPPDLGAIVRDAPSWGPFDGGPRPRVLECRMPDREGVLLARLFARDPAAYRGLESGAPQEHQALVLELFEPASWSPPGPGRPPEGLVRLPDGRSVLAGAPAGRLVVADDGRGAGLEGLVFGVVDPAGELLASGRLATCLGCHADAPHAGLFGDEWRAARAR